MAVLVTARCTAAGDLHAGADRSLGADVLAAAGRLGDLIYRRRLSETLTRNENAGAAEVNGIETSLQWPVWVRGLRILRLADALIPGITRNDAVPASVGKVLTKLAEMRFVV